MPTCENQTCRRTYKRTRTWQKYCSGSCRATARNQGIRERTASVLGHQVLETAMAWQEAQGDRAATALLWDACENYRQELAEREEP